DTILATKAGDEGAPQPQAEELLPLVRWLPQGDPPDQARAAEALLEGRPVRGVHAYFAHEPAAVAREVAHALGVPWGFSTHARDARKVAPAELARRAAEAAVIVACNGDVAGDLRAVGGRVSVVPHGVDLERFAPAPAPPAPPLRLLAVGRLVEKKGFRDLIAALAQMRADASLTIVGDGPERDALAAAARDAGVADRVRLAGPVGHDRLPAVYASSHVVVVPSVVDRSGDRDGLPNVVLEAMASGRPVLGTRAGAITSAVEDGVTGVVVEPGDAAAMAAALDRLADEGLRARFGAAGHDRVVRDFGLDACARRFVEVLEGAYG
ncbi:MAG TPA: glycosyltransferase family 4 protein, partial [Miltoncostaeaceae bacterium]|nr:glycosyltransferase family 4 protein [Miltoncostaeaceae bacterium]